MLQRVYTMFVQPKLNLKLLAQPRDLSDKKNRVSAERRKSRSNLPAFGELGVSGDTAQMAKRVSQFHGRGSKGVSRRIETAVELRPSDLAVVLGHSPDADGRAGTTSKPCCCS